MSKRRKRVGSSPPDAWQRGNFLLNLARLVLEVFRWSNGGGPRI